MGSHGTVVFKGSLQGRAVAVKRMLADFVTLASREVNVLQESDDHPNVIRYYYQEAHANFLYIALELCPASLADVIERPDQYRDIVVSFDPKKALRQITSGLRHLHALKIVHRDIKPQNLLLDPNTGVLKLCDFGSAKILVENEPNVSYICSRYYRAPELIFGATNYTTKIGKYLLVAYVMR